ncbi:MAG: cellulase family glycosylhydrolase [Eubacteriales bacterium]|nr:cellulase family glycosylhydrolase [Eubacteriales bacterium]
MKEKIRGVNLGNWLVLERWMNIHLFEETDAEDEVWLTRMTEPEKLARLLKEHRETYITEADFAAIKAHGINLVRIPVPYFVFGDRQPFIGCIEYLDRAFAWAEKYDLPLMLDLHTVPGSQNGYDNGGLTGVCKWCKDPAEVEFTLTVLERLAKRYGKRKGLYGIQVVNEPISWLVYITAPSTGKARDKEEAKGSGHVPMSFLKPFYLEAYRRMRVYMPEEKAIIFHDGFRIGRWKRFFRENDLKNVLLDTHVYIFAMEGFVPIPKMWVYKLYVNRTRRQIEKASKDVPVVVGEWCISQKYAVNCREDREEQKKRFREVADLQLKAWSVSAGYIYWSYQLWKDREAEMDDPWKEPWDLIRCWKNGWMPEIFE